VARAEEVTLAALSLRVDPVAAVIVTGDAVRALEVGAVTQPTPPVVAEALDLPPPEQMFAAAFDTDGVVDGAGEARGLGALPPRAPPLRLAQPALDTSPEGGAAPRRRPVLLASVDSADSLRRLLDQHDLAIRPGAVLPDLFLHRLPGDIAAIRQAEERKAVFMRTLLPLVLKVNETWLARRQRVDALAPLMAIGAPLHPIDQAELDALLRDIRMDRWNHEEVLRRLDAIPPSLALAQAAEESGWGTSNAARTLNALFGEMVARGPDAGQIRRFEDLSSTVAAYIRNLNTHPAYAEMRRRRAQLRALGEPVDGPALIPFLLRYSESGPDYIATIIRMNNLTQSDDVRLTQSPQVAAAP
jgi:Bax protein